MREELELLIIPDVHGRSFWRESVDDVLKNSDKHIVFLGDYTDSYSFDKIPVGTELDAFYDILALKKEYSDRITLLQGNHDMGYSISSYICDCRTDRKHYSDIRKAFRDNKDNFDLAYETEINGKKFMLSHGGLTKKWLDAVQISFPEFSGSVSDINKFFHTESDDALTHFLGMVSWSRGGFGEIASIVWASAIDDTNPSTMFGDSIQIVGHTQLQMPLKYGDKLYFVDAREPIYITSNGDVLKYNDGERIVDVEEVKNKK